MIIIYSFLIDFYFHYIKSINTIVKFLAFRQKVACNKFILFADMFAKLWPIPSSLEYLAGILMKENKHNCQKVSSLRSGNRFINKNFTKNIIIKYSWWDSCFVVFCFVNPFSEHYVLCIMFFSDEGMNPPFVDKYNFYVCLFNFIVVKRSSLFF